MSMAETGGLCEGAADETPCAALAVAGIMPAPPGPPAGPALPECMELRAVLAVRLAGADSGCAIEAADADEAPWRC